MPPFPLLVPARQNLRKSFHTRRKQVAVWESIKAGSVCRGSGLPHFSSSKGQYSNTSLAFVKSLPPKHFPDLVDISTSYKLDRPQRSTFVWAWGADIFPTQKKWKWSFSHPIWIHTTVCWWLVANLVRNSTLGCIKTAKVSQTTLLFWYVLGL